MRQRVLLSAVLMGFVLAPPTPAQEAAESLPEAAAKEKERRRASAKTKTYTEADLGKAGSTRPAPVSAVEPSTPEATPTPAPGPGAREKTDDEIRAEKKAEFEKRIAAEVKVTEAVRKAMDEAQLELNDPTTLTQFGSRKEALQRILDDGQAELKKSEAAIAAIEEEARRQGISVSRP
jgi:hypothetical protein